MEKEISERLQKKYELGTVTIRDLRPELNTSFKVRHEGFVDGTHEEITEQIEKLSRVWGTFGEALKAFSKENNYVERLKNTYYFIENYFQKNGETTAER